MKSFNKPILLIAALLILNACSDDHLDLVNPNAITTASFWNSEEDIASGVTACYDVLSSVFMHGHYMNLLLDLVSDESRPSWSKTNEWTVLAKFEGDASQDSHSMVWTACYMGIFRCNQVLGYIDQIEMDEQNRLEYKGQVYFLRAYYNLYLVTLYRHVPLINELPEEFEDYYQKQAEETEVYNHIVSDLEKALEYLPSEYENMSSSYGRATRGTALAYLGKTHVFRACHLNEPGSWALAEQYLLQVIPDMELGGSASSPYRLFDAYGSDYEANCRANGNLKDENNQESIFEIQFESSYGSQNHTAYDAWSFDQPASTKASLRGIYFAPPGFGWGDVFPSAFTEKLYQKEKDMDGNDDPRRGATLTYNREGETLYGVKFSEWYSGGDLKDYFWKKFVGVDTEGRTDEMDWHSSINQRVMRLAEVYLLLAECVNEQGRTAEAYPFIQKVRDRANMPELATAKPGMDRTEMRAQICSERVLELCAEGVRWLDLVRWDRYSNLTGENWFSMADTMHSRGRAGFIAGKHELCPIPQSEIDANPNIEQNYLW